MSEQHVVYKFQPDQTKSNLHKVIYMCVCVTMKFIMRESDKTAAYAAQNMGKKNLENNL
jgi:uncharacterized protein YfcZ (UPF0381/DUF406 family)